MAEEKSAPVTQRRQGGRHLAPSSQETTARRPARPRQRSRTTDSGRQVDAAKLYKHFVPYIKDAHHHNERSLHAGVWLLVLLPIVLAFIRELTDASKIVFLIIWIFGMFGIATALIFTAYSDHSLKETLKELENIVPPEEEIEIGNLLPVDAEGEGWLIDPGDLPIPLPDLAERLPQMGEELRERRAIRETQRQAELSRRRNVRRQRAENLQQILNGSNKRTTSQSENKIGAENAGREAAAEPKKMQSPTNPEAHEREPRHLADSKAGSPAPIPGSVNSDGAPGKRSGSSERHIINSGDGSATHEEMTGQKAGRKTGNRMQLDNDFLETVGGSRRNREKR